jgi:hypothetical protein
MSDGDAGASADSACGRPDRGAGVSYGVDWRAARFGRGGYLYLCGTAGFDGDGEHDGIDRRETGDKDGGYDGAWGNDHPGLSYGVDWVGVHAFW